MESPPPKPVITYFGDEAVLSSVLQKKLQGRIGQSQVHSLSKEDSPYSCFNVFCEGVEFLHFPFTKERLKGGDCPIYQRPALHTFWSSCYDANNYRTRAKPHIKQWLDDISKLGGGGGGHTPAMSLIIYCVTAEVRARKQRPLLANSSIEERLRTDYKNLADEIIVFRLASAEESRLVESSQALVAKLNVMALAKFSKSIDREMEVLARQENVRIEPDLFYKDCFIRKLDIAVACEMTVQSKTALKLYSEAARNLEDALTQFSDAATPPKWLKSMCQAPCKTWDYPKLAWTQLSWRYLADIRKCLSPLLHTRTFLLVRVSHLLFVLDRAWSVSEEVISTLHSMAREIKVLKLTFPAGAFDCWAYMACKEAIQAFMARINPDSLMSATSSLLLVRAELWHYALQKLHDVGVLCGLMPSSNKLNYDKVLIQQISSGITPVPSQIQESYNLMGVDDLGSELQSMLSDRKEFQSEFLSLGEMVIGAFKHAGRRRMAFRVGTMMAQFHRDLGLMVEAEELLSDICKFYSEDQWLELSTKAYSLLADCQMKLKLEEKHINTMLLLASFPPYPAASHDPTPWMTRVVKIAQHSPYQKLLSWDPLLELVRIEGGGRKNGVYIGDQVHLDLVINLYAPKELKNLIVTVQTKLYDSTSSPSHNSTPSSGMHTPHRGHLMASPTLSQSSLGNLDDLDLESASAHPHSRPIGESSKYRSTSHVMHISHADITEMEALMRHDEETSLLSFMATGEELRPGSNRFTLKGKGRKEGDYIPHKISIKFGALDFAYTVPEAKAMGHSFAILERQVNVEVSLYPKDSVFLAGCVQECEMTFSTSGNTSIPPQAAVRIPPLASPNSGLAVSLAAHEAPLPPPTESDGPDGLKFNLPAVKSGEACHVGVVLKAPPVNAVLQRMLPAEEADVEVAWKYLLEVFCDWLTPPLSATLPVVVYEPLGLTCLEHCTGSQSFLQLVLTNTCPVPLLVRHPALIADKLDLESLHSNLPEVFYPQDSYSFLWRANKTCRYLDRIPDKIAGTFEVEFCPLPADFDSSASQLPASPLYSDLQYRLSLSGMQTIFELRLKVEATDHASILAHQPATLVCTITNITTPPPQETRFGFTTPRSNEGTTPSSSAPPSPPQKVGYEVLVDRASWGIIKGSGKGAFDIPAPQKKKTLQFQVVPAQSGFLQLPSLQLYRLGGSRGGEQGDKLVLTDAQVYSTSRGQLVSVHSEDSNPR